MNERYPGLAKIEGQAKQFFESTFLKKSKKFTIGFTVGDETFTFLGGMIILDRYDEYMADAEGYYQQPRKALDAWRKCYAMGNDPHAFHALDVDNMLAANNN